MDILQAIFLGIVQGVTEVLPISSSGHLILIPWVFNFNDPGLFFDVALHLGTLFAVIFFFYQDILQLVKGGINIIIKKDPSDTYQKLFLFLLLTTIPGVIAGVLLDKYAESIFRNPILIATTLSFFGLVLLFADRMGKQTKSFEKVGILDSLIIGTSQALAIIPGVSRSGITMSAGLFRGLKRDEAARFSFLLSIPIIFGAALYSFKGLPFSELLSPVFVAGFLSSAIAGFLSIRFLMNYLKSHTFNIFVIYRFILAGIILIIYFSK